MKPAFGVLGLVALLAASPLAATGEDKAAAEEGVSSVAAPPAASPAPPKSQSDITVQGPKEDKPICRRETVTGSIRTVRVCLTKAEREERERQAEQSLSDLHDRQEAQDLIRRAGNEQF